MKELPIACSLDAAALADRTERWRALAQSAMIAAESTPTGARQRYRAADGVETELRELIELEGRCCAFLDLRLDTSGHELVLEVTGPPEAKEIIAAFAAH
jgi:hypothetical protein